MPSVRMRTRSALVAALLLGSAIRLPQAPALAAGSPIKHVVVLFQENHSFDSVLGKFCQDVSKGRIPRTGRCDGATVGKLPTGNTIGLRLQPDVVPQVGHGVADQQTSIASGRMDGFSLISGCTASTSFACYSQDWPPRDMPTGQTSGIANVTTLARRFAISDRTFELRQAPSWGGHLVLASATMDGFSGNNPALSQFTPKLGPGWGCDSFRDADWWNPIRRIGMKEPSCIPNGHGQGPYRPSPVPYVPTIMDRLTSAHRSWKIYGGTGSGVNGVGVQINGYGWTICPSFYGCFGNPLERRNLVPAAQVLNDARGGSLPAFSIVTPVSANSQHNGNSMRVGDNWIGQVVSAIMQGPDWSSTAIFITWDDCGCFYDHVDPLRYGVGWGIRVPMLIVSPYARPGYTDSNPATFAGILRFTERVFNLMPLNPCVRLHRGRNCTDDLQGPGGRRTYGFGHAFNYLQKPLTPVRMVDLPISALEHAFIVAHPMSDQDPT